MDVATSIDSWKSNCKISTIWTKLSVQSHIDEGMFSIITTDIQTIPDNASPLTLLRVSFYSSRSMA